MLTLLDKFNAFKFDLLVLKYYLSIHKYLTEPYTIVLKKFVRW